MPSGTIIVSDIVQSVAQFSWNSHQITKPDEYQAYQNFRILAKSLADGWINRDK